MQSKKIIKSILAALALLSLAIGVAVALFTLIRKPKTWLFCDYSLTYIVYCSSGIGLGYIPGYLVPWYKISCEYNDFGILEFTSSGNKHSGCLASFIVIFYFQTATTGWFLVWAFCKVVTSINKNYLHIFVWLLSALLTFMAYVTQKTYAEEITATCHIGDAVLLYSCVPNTLKLLGGLVFLVIALIKNRVCKADIVYAFIAVSLLVSWITRTTKFNPRNNISFDRLLN